MRRTLPAAIASLIALALLAVGNAHAAGCDRIGMPKKFGIPDRWHVSDQLYLGEAKFGEACDAFAACYGTVNRPKSLCDREYVRALHEECEASFKNNDDALNRCHRQVKKAVDFMKTESATFYRRSQHDAAAAARAAERKARADARKARYEERRRRRADYAKQQSVE